MSQSTDVDVVEEGTIESVSGPVVSATGLNARMNDVVYVGTEGLMGEVIEIEGDITTVQVYEDTSGVSPGEPVQNTGEPLTVDLGPGMLNSIYDGVQRPLDVLESRMGTPFLDRGVDAPGIDLEKTWSFTPTVESGDEVSPGEIVGTVPETESIEHRIMVPPDSDGGIVADAREGAYTVDQPVVTLENGEEITMHQEWPVREPRPAEAKHSPTVPLISGQRILDGLFPIAKGGTAAIPGPFGSGKCVTPDTPVLLATGETVPIERLFERLTDEAVTETGEVYVEADAEIMTYDPDSGRIRPAPISHVYRGMTDEIVTVRTASGRELEVTPTHKLFRVTGDSTIEETPAGRLAEGDELLMPRRLSIPGRIVDIDPYERIPLAHAVEDRIIDEMNDLVEDAEVSPREIAHALERPRDEIRNCLTGRSPPTLEFVAELCDWLDEDRPRVERVSVEPTDRSIRIPPHIDERFAEFIGLVYASGSVSEGGVRFHHTERSCRRRFAGLAEALFDLPQSQERHDQVNRIILDNAVVSGLLTELGFAGTETANSKGVPPSILRADDVVVAAFLRGMCLGNESLADSVIEPSNELAASNLSYLLTRLGIPYRFDDTSQGEWKIEVTGTEGLDEWIDSITTTSQRRGHDRSPESHLSARRSAEQAPAGPVRSDGGWADKSSSPTLDEGNDVFVDPIVEITTLRAGQTVYDVTVPETQNFVGGGVPAILHNTVAQHQLAKWADADIVVYVGCGERGNEMTEVIDDFPELEDPKTGKPLMSRTCLIANTSNMPVAARESCVYTGITIAEYFRDMGYDVALMADSTSRWAEAMREISSRLEEMPGEEGYPAYLAARLAQFYERSGSFDLLNGDHGTVSVIGAVSPPGGDFSEPVTQNTLRIVKTFWALDADLAERRHFPAINWNESYSLYRGQLDPWYRDNVDSEYPELRQWGIDTLDEEAELQEIVQLVGKDALPEDQQLTLEVARYLRDAWLAQNAFHDVDTYCEPTKTYRMLEAIKTFNDEAYKALNEGVPVSEIQAVDAAPQLNRMGAAEEWESFISDLEAKLTSQLRELY